jgi:hypothetical protein
MRKSVFPVLSQVIEAPSGGALARKKPPKGVSAILYRNPEKASDAQKPAAKAFDIPDASDPAFWANTTWNFYQPETDGSERHVWSAKLSIYDNQAFELFMYVGETYGGMMQEQYVLDHISGTMQMNTAPSLWMALPGTGDEQLVDTGNPALDYDNPLDISLAWFVNPYRQDGSGWDFVNGNYQWPWNNFIFNRVPNAFTAAKPLIANKGALLSGSSRRRA